jgi:ribosomal protein L34
MHVRRTNTKRRKRKAGFRARMKTSKGRKIVNRRRRLRGTFP